MGRDIVAGDGVQLETGTYQAVNVFLEDHLGVRWLWPGKWDTDVPKEASICLGPLSIRYTPPVQLQSIGWTNHLRGYKRLTPELKKQAEAYGKDRLKRAVEKDAQTREFLNNHHVDRPPTGARITPIAGSRWLYRNGHTFHNWYAKYGKDHPDWFALQADGTRIPYPDEANAKMNIANPELFEEWLRINIEFLKENPHVNTASVSVGDHGWEGFSLDPESLAWDNPNAPILPVKIRWKGESREFYSLTDRYMRFANLAAERLVKEFPDRDMHIASFCYHVTQPAPTIGIAANIIPEFVGIERRNYRVNSRAHTQEQFEIWKQWWEAIGRRHQMIWRPNINIRAIGLPYIFTERHADTMNLLADHGLAGIRYDAGGEWATQAPQMYLMAKLAWNPKADRSLILDDYYQRAFGPAAAPIQRYFALFEELFTKLTEQYRAVGYHDKVDVPRLFREIRLDDEPATARLKWASQNITTTKKQRRSCSKKPKTRSKRPMKNSESEWASFKPASIFSKHIST